jgi:steroid delta-isomerase-like uncharacterized protein
VTIPEAETATTPEAVARAIFAALSKGDLDGAFAFVAPEAVDDFVAIGEFVGRDAIHGFFRDLFAAFPRFEIEVERVVADDGNAVTQWRAAGEFTGGPFLGIEPTGRRVEIRGIDVMQIEGGLVRHNTIYYDGAAFARQVGQLPTRDSGMDRAMLSAFNAVTKARSSIRNRNRA